MDIAQELCEDLAFRFLVVEDDFVVRCCNIVVLVAFGERFMSDIPNDTDAVCTFSK